MLQTNNRLETLCALFGANIAPNALEFQQMTHNIHKWIHTQWIKVKWIYAFMHACLFTSSFCNNNGIGLGQWNEQYIYCKWHINPIRSEEEERNSKFIEIET